GGKEGRPADRRIRPRETRSCDPRRGRIPRSATARCSRAAHRRSCRCRPGADQRDRGGSRPNPRAGCNSCAPRARAALARGRSALAPLRARVMRVIAGDAKGRTLVVPRGGGPRAATDRIRETLFAILEPALEGARVLDLFAGAGTLGIEALSRGAIHATFVERGKEAVGALRKNLAATDFTDRASVVEANVLSFLSEPPIEPFDLAFCDPPFVDVELANATLAHPGLAASLPADALVVARFHKKHRPPPPPRPRAVRPTEIGEETLLSLRYSGLAAGG